MAKQTQAQKAWYEKNREKAIERSVRWQKEHPEEYSKRLKKWRQENMERELERSRQWKAENYEKHLASSREYGRKHSAEISTKRKQARRELKQTIVNAYGGKCACCGVSELEFLTIDHINGDGASHRKSLGPQGGKSHVFYKHIIQEKFPDVYRVLCFNCNSALGFYGYCPHNPNNKDGVPTRRRGAKP